MLNKKLIILAIVLISLLSVSAVSATDNATIDVVGMDRINDDLSDDDDDFYNFFDFECDVNSGANKIVLEHDYKDDFNPDDYDDDSIDSWSIESSVEIDGNGHVLDWDYSPTSISVYADDVVMKNIVFRNFKNSSDYTTALDWSGSKGVIENCTFIGNTFGIGFFMADGESLVINNCKFINNYGATIVWLNNDNPTLTNCEFRDNIVVDSGNGFICSQVDNGAIYNNVFKNNIYSNSNGVLCFDPFDVYEESTVGTNLFLNRGVLLNNGVRYRCELMCGGVFRALVVGSDGKAVGAGEDVKVNFNIIFYEELDDDEETPAILKNATLSYNLKTDSNGFIYLNVDDIITDSRIGEQSMTFRISCFGMNSWGEFISDDLIQSSVLFMAFDYNGGKTSIGYVGIMSSVGILDADGDWYLTNVGKSSIVDYGNYAKYTFWSYFFDLNGNELANKEITFIIGQNVYKAKTDKYGIASKTVNLNYGTYDVFVKNPVTNQELSDSIKVVKRLNNNKDVTKYYKSSTNYKVRVFDDNGKIAKNAYVKFTIGKSIKSVYTDKNGYATLKLDQKPGKYTVKVQCGAHTVSNKVVIKSTIITKNVVKKVKKSGKFKVKILNGKGKPYAKKVVKIKFKGKTYKIKTNKKGIATFKIPKNLKKGKYAIKTTYNGYTVSNKLTVK